MELPPYPWRACVEQHTVQQTRRMANQCLSNRHHLQSDLAPCRKRHPVCVCLSNIADFAATTTRVDARYAGVDQLQWLKARDLCVRSLKCEQHT